MSFIDKRIQCELPDPPIKEECPICMEKMDKKGIAITECGHKFCLKCLLMNYYRSNKCPLCRSLVVNKNKNSKIKNREASDPLWGSQGPIAQINSRNSNDPSTIQTRTTRYHELVETALLLEEESRGIV